MNKISLLFIVFSLLYLISLINAQFCQNNIAPNIICNKNTGLTVEMTTDFNRPELNFWMEKSNGKTSEKFYIELDRVEEFEETEDDPKRYELESDTRIDFSSAETFLQFGLVQNYSTPEFESVALVAYANFTGEKKVKNTFEQVLIRATIIHEEELAILDFYLQNYTWEKGADSDSRLRARFYMDNEARDEELNRSDDFKVITAQHQAQFTDWKAEISQNVDWDQWNVREPKVQEQNPDTLTEVDVDTFAGPSFQGRSIFSHMHYEQRTNQTIFYTARFGMGSASSVAISISMIVIAIILNLVLLF